MCTTNTETAFEWALRRAVTDGTYRASVLAAEAAPAEARLTTVEWRRLRGAVQAQEAERAAFCGRAGRAAAGRLQIVMDLSR